MDCHHRCFQGPLCWLRAHRKCRNGGAHWRGPRGNTDDGTLISLALEIPSCCCSPCLPEGLRNQEERGGLQTSHPAGTRSTGSGWQSQEGPAAAPQRRGPPVGSRGNKGRDALIPQGPWRTSRTLAGSRKCVSVRDGRRSGIVHIFGLCLRLGRTHIPACLSTQETQR